MCDLSNLPVDEVLNSNLVFSLILIVGEALNNGLKPPLNTTTGTVVVEECPGETKKETKTKGILYLRDKVNMLRGSSYV
jgi:hypothetical protein